MTSIGFAKTSKPQILASPLVGAIKPGAGNIRIDDANMKFRNNFNLTLKEYEEDFKNCLVNSDSIKVVCYRNATKKNINNLIRETIFNKASEIPYQQGDVIILDNNWEKLENSQEFVVLDSTQVLEGDYLLYKIKAIKSNSLDTKHYFIYVLNEFSVEHHKKKVAELFTKAKATKNRQILADAWDLKNKYALLSYNYCSSTHRSQGSTYNKTIVMEDDIMSSYMSQKEKNQCMYVAITRSKEQTIIIKS